MVENESPTKAEKTTAKKPMIEGKWSLIAIAVILIAIIAVAMYSYITQPITPKPANLHAYIVDNINTTNSINTLSPSYVIVNSSFTLNSITSTVNSISLNKVRFTPDNKTYIYYFGINGCGSCQVETYILWNYFAKSYGIITPNSYPAFNSSFVIGWVNLPGIPVSALTAFANSYSGNYHSNVTLVSEESNLTEAQLMTQSNQTTNAQLKGWAEGNWSAVQLYLYSETGSFPTVLVTRSNANYTMICSGYAPISYVEYNATSTDLFLGQDMKNQTIGSVLPTPASMNANRNLLASCINLVDNKWKGGAT